MKKKLLITYFLSITFLVLFIPANQVLAKSTWKPGVPTKILGTYNRKVSSMGQRVVEPASVTKNKFEYGLGDKRVFKHLSYKKIKNNVWIIRGKEVSLDNKPTAYQKIMLKKQKLGIFHEPDTKLNKDRTFKGVKKAKAVNWYKKFQQKKTVRSLNSKY